MSEQREQAVAYIKECLSHNVPEADIRAVLTENHFSAAIIDEAFAATRGTPRPAALVPPKGMFKRRIGRLGFFLGGAYLAVPVVPLYIVILIIAMLFPNQHLPTVATGAVLFFVLGIYITACVVTASLYVRRLHDMGLSGKLAFLALVPYVAVLLEFLELSQGHSDEAALLALVPLLGTIFYLYLQFAPGNKTANKYGPSVETLNFWVVLGFKKPRGQ
jgi:uncharacterized membrane protein YhaH (DUF805 family)